MSERGFIRLERDALEHPFFRRREFSEFEAWVWMLNEANWKPRTRRVGNFTVDLGRGELAASIRYLGEKWLWDRGKVDRFLRRLKTETMIETRTVTGINVITICNYDKYQSASDAYVTDDVTANGTAARQHRDSTVTKQKEINTSTIEQENQKEKESRSNDRSDITDDQSSSSGNPIEAPPLDETLLPKEPELGFQHPEPRARGTALVPIGNRPSRSIASTGEIVGSFEAWWSAYPRKKSKDGARKKYAEIIKAGRASEQELLDGAIRYASEQVGQDPRYTKHPTTWLNNGCWADEPSPPKFIHPPTRSSADSAIDGIRAFLEENDCDATEAY